jgi:putative ABC transport system permease protein
VGVVGDVHAAELDGESSPQFYVPFTDVTMGTPSRYLLRTSRPIAALRRDATAILKQFDPSATVVVQAARDLMALPLASRRLSSLATASLALVALLLAVISVYALSAFAVIERTREIGIRIALGARQVDALRLVLGRALLRVGTGLALGTILTVVLASPLLDAEMYQTSTRDPRVLVTMAVLVFVFAALASWLPARRAARIDPAVTLKAE